MLEAPPRFELGIKALQASALPLGDGAVTSENSSLRQGPLVISNHCDYCQEKSLENLSSSHNLVTHNLFSQLLFNGAQLSLHRMFPITPIIDFY